MSIIGEFRVGETISLALDALAGDPQAVSGPEAFLAPAEVRGGVTVVREGAARVPAAAGADRPAPLARKDPR